MGGGPDRDPVEDNSRNQSRHSGKKKKDRFEPTSSRRGPSSEIRTPAGLPGIPTKPQGKERVIRRRDRSGGDWFDTLWGAITSYHGDQVETEQGGWFDVGDNEEVTPVERGMWPDEP